MSKFNRCISLLLVLGILLGILAPVAQAAPMEETATVNTDNITIEGTNGFGELLSQELTKNQNETAEGSSEYSGAYSVTDLEITDGVATVTYDSMEEATLVVALYTEDGMQLITSATATVTPDATEATVTFGREMPEYFMASAYLLDSYDFSPLCASYETPMYTREMQELLESTVDDYDPEKVLNLDDDKTTNFAVYADSTVVIEPAKGVNTVATIDDENAVYVIKNADEQIKSLVEGDVFVYPYAEGELLIVKVETITINGTTATITGSDLELEEVFSYMKIENTGSTEDMIVVEDSGDEGVTYIGLQRKNTVNPSAWGDNAELQFSMGFNVEKEIDQYSSFSGSLGIQFDVEFEYYISLKRQFIRFEYGSEVAVKIGYQLQANAPIPKATSKLKLKSFGYSPVAGVYLGFEPEIVVEFTATVEVACTLRASGGFSYESGKGADDLSKKPTVDIDIKFEGVIFFGIDFAPHISILKDNVAKIKLSSQVGLELTGKTTGSMFEDIILAGDAPREKHDCELCITVDLAVKADFSLQIELLKCDWLTFECKLAAKRFKIGACYYSDTYDDFGWGECPHKLYRLTIVVIDEESRNIAGAVVTADKFTETTNQNGAAIFYLTDGTYTVEVNDGTLVKSKTVQISDPAKVSIKLDDGDNSGSEDDSALGWITGDIGSEDIIDQWHGYVVDTGTCGENLYWELYEDGYLYIGGSGDMSSSPFSYELKEKIRFVEISSGCTSIGEYAFDSCDELKTVTIQAGCEEIGRYAFSGCAMLTTVTLPTTLISIKGAAFQNCASLRDINLPTALTSIGGSAFYGCTDLTTIILPESLDTLGNDAFAFSGLTSIDIPGGITKINSETFWNCDELKTVTIHEGCEEIGDHAFSSCDELKTVTIHEGCEEIGRYAFSGCAALTTVSLPTTLISIEGAAFQNCASLRDINLPTALTSIGGSAFYGCTDLTTIILPESLDTLGNDAFAFSGLTSIDIPGGITKINSETFWNCDELKRVIIREGCEVVGDYAFSSCDELSEVYFKGDAPEISNSVFSGITATAYYPAGNATWNGDVMKDYGGTITWAPCLYGAVIALDSVHDNVIVYEEEAFTIIPTPDVAISLSVHDVRMKNRQAEPATTDPCLYHEIPELNAVYPGAYDTEITDTYTLKTASFKDLVPGEQYVLLAMASIEVEDPLNADNLLFIDQAEALEDGTLVFQYVQRIPSNISYVVACGASNKNLNDAVITFPKMVADGELQVVDPTVVYEGKTLFEGRDYVITGRVDFTEAGEYTCYIRGIHNYTGLVECSYTVTEAELVNPFTDVPEGSFYHVPVLWAVANGITNGTTATTFGPEDQCMRAHVVTFLWRAAGSPEPESNHNPFVDVNENDFYYKAVLWAVEKGITNGLDATHFGPLTYCNRAQVVTFLWRAQGQPEAAGLDMPFTDVATDAWYETPIRWAVANGITNGMSATSFGINVICNRAQIVTFLYRTYN